MGGSQTGCSLISLEGQSWVGWGASWRNDVKGDPGIEGGGGSFLSSNYFIMSFLPSLIFLLFYTCHGMSHNPVRQDIFSEATVNMARICSFIFVCMLLWQTGGEGCGSRVREDTQRFVRVNLHVFTCLCIFLYLYPSVVVFS